MWVTRERPKIDRIACPWLIRRFIEPGAEFLYVPADQVFAVAADTGAVPYDIPGAEPFSHDGELCSFDAFLKQYNLNDPALHRLATIVRGADTARPDLAPQAAGLLAISLGLSANYPDDHVMLMHGMVVYDALYTWCRSLQHETHNWQPLPRGYAGRAGRAVSQAPFVEFAPAAPLPSAAPLVRHGIGLAEATRVWVRVALLSFGGPAGQIAVMHRILVDECHWISEARFLHALNYCMLLPGPEAQQLATYIGWLMHRTRGGLIAGTLFVLPGAGALMALSWIYVLWGDVGLVGGLFFGLKAAVLAVVIEAVLRVGRRALKSRFAVGVAALAFAALFLFRVPFPIVVLVAAAAGFAAHRLGCRVGMAASHQAREGDLLGEAVPAHATPSLGRALRVAALWLPLWLGPVLVLVATLGPQNVFARLSVFFSQVAVVTFGGAYAVLAYVAQQAVQTYHWVGPSEMLTGLGMAETTPGPLIMVVQYVGFLAGYRDPGALPPLLAGTLAGLLVTWVTFTPCFLWVFLGAPYVEALRGARALNAALSAVTAAVVGVILNLAVWFAIHVMFRQVAPWRGLDVPVIASLDPLATILALTSALALFRFKLGVIPTLLGCSLAGAVLLLGFGGVR